VLFAFSYVSLFCFVNLYLSSLLEFISNRIGEKEKRIAKSFYKLSVKAKK